MEKCCAECPEPRAGHSLCTHCNKWLCFQCTDLHAHGRSSTHSQRGTSPPETGSACCEHAVVMCPLHKQETLGLLCETCDLMTCSICHLSAHKDHRLVHVTKALQDQQWLLENLMARVEEKRSAVENTAKQIQGRLHGVKITQRKAENQIKMAKMIMMNELNKRAKLLIEQLEGVSSSFKQHLEDQLQGAIELCSQLEHVQNFITWAMANHRRNPLLFSKELIALQMQQFLEPLQYSETWTPLKVKFNWDASFWTKQISTLGQLSVEGGSHPYSEAAGPRLPYSEAAGRTGILRPQPVSCRAVPSLCHPVREADCAYQAFCQPQLCCVHCRAAQSLSLDKYTCSQHPSSSAPAVQGPVQRSWDLESSSLAPPPLVRLQRSSPPSPSTGALRQQGPHIPQPRHELPATPEQAAPSSRATGLRQRSGSQEGEPTATPTPIATPTPATEQQLLPQRQQQLDEASGQRSAASSPSPEHPCEPRVPSSKAVRTTSPHTDMHAPASACGADVLNPASPEETGRSRSGTQPGSGMRGGGPDVNAQRLVMGAEEMEHVTLQECGRPSVADSMVTPAQTQTHPPSSLTTYKTEPDVYTYTDNTDKCRTRSGASREVQDSSSREVNDTSKVPVVCLERLNTVIPRQAPQGEQSAALSRDSGLKAERSACVELGREHVAEGVSREEAVECLPGGAPVRGTSPAPPGPGVELQERTAPDTPHAPSSGPSPCPDSEGENASDQTEHNPSEPKSGPVSDSLLESATEADLGSEAEVESELQAESDPSLESEARVDSDSDLEWEQPPDSELLAESERDLVSDPDSAAEVSLSLEQEGEWGAGQGGGSEPRAGPSTAAQPPEEMESEDFCAVCLIGGDLLCCDRCPKVFHLACHVPSLLSFPSGDWVCTLCRDVDWPEVEYDSEDARLHTDAAPSGLSACERRKCEKLILHIYSNILSTPFHEPVSPLARHYYQIIRRPMDLSVIRSRLCESSSTHYSSPSEFVADVLLMFKNCAKFNYPDSEVAQAGRNLQAFFRTKLREVFPSLSCPSPQDDSDSEEAEEAEREAAAAGFPWPERREQNHRKRKRRPSLSWRRHHY